jgi:hypothetical protein
MDPELRLLDLVRRDWWVLVIVLCIIWAIECHLEGNSVIETIEAPLLVVAWGGLILLIDRWALRASGLIGRGAWGENAWKAPARGSGRAGADTQGRAGRAWPEGADDSTAESFWRLPLLFVLAACSLRAAFVRCMFVENSRVWFSTSLGLWKRRNFGGL